MLLHLDKVSSRRIQIVRELARRSAALTVPRISQLVQCSRTTAYRDIDALEDQELVASRGVARRHFYLCVHVDFAVVWIVAHALANIDVRASLLRVVRKCPKRGGVL